MKWRTSKQKKMEVAWYQIEKELAVIGDIQHKDILDIDHVESVSYTHLTLPTICSV